MAKKNFKVDNLGSAIAYGLIIVSAISIILVSVMQFVSSQMRYASYAEAKEKAFHIAESGIYFYRWYLAHSIEERDQEEIESFWEDEDNPPLGFGETYVRDILAVNGDKIGEAAIDVSLPTAGNYNVVEVTSTGHTIDKPQIKRKIKVRMRRSLWSDYAIISDAPVCFDKYWTINGKVMGNKGVHFDGVATNTVYAGVRTYDDNNNLHSDPVPRNNPGKPGVWSSWPAGQGCDHYNTEKGKCVFSDVPRFPVPKKDFSGVPSFISSIRTRSRGVDNGCNASGTGCYFDSTGEGRHIILNANGTFYMCKVDQYDTSQGNNRNWPKKYMKLSGNGTCNTCDGLCRATFTIPNNGFIFVENNIWLEGTLNNKHVTIAAASVSNPNTAPNIFVTNNILYARKDGSAILGIIAENDVEILRGTPNQLEIDGAILTQNGALTKPEYNPECCGKGCSDNKNYIKIVGNVVTKGGLHFSLHKQTCPNLNIDRTITYDTNLYFSPPPLFPADSFYYVDFWEEL